MEKETALVILEEMEKVWAAIEEANSRLAELGNAKINFYELHISYAKYKYRYNPAEEIADALQLTRTYSQFDERGGLIRFNWNGHQYIGGIQPCR